MPEYRAKGKGCRCIGQTRNSFGVFFPKEIRLYLHTISPSNIRRNSS